MREEEEKNWYHPGMYGDIQDIYQPWYGRDTTSYGEFAEEHNNDSRARTVVSPDRVWIVRSYAKYVLEAGIRGCIWECGVYKGGTAIVLSNLLKRYGNERPLMLFDTFTGMPETQEIDAHKEGDFADTSLDSVKSVINYPNTHFFPGFIPDTFVGLEDQHIAFAYVDVDIYKSTIDCCDFIWPRLTTGGVMVFDDYGFDQTIGCKKAVDEFFADKHTYPVVLPTGQAVVIKGQY